MKERSSYRVPRNSTVQTNDGQTCTLQFGYNGSLLQSVCECVVAAVVVTTFLCEFHLSLDGLCTYYCPDFDDYVTIEEIGGEYPDTLEWYPDDPPPFVTP